MLEALAQQFRAVALERIGHIEAAWNQVQESFDGPTAVTMHREIHTLKGESKMLGFDDVHLVCHKTEELLDVARAIGYAMDGELDVSITKALQLMSLLVRRSSNSQALSGIDVHGFLRQMDGILAAARRRKKDDSGRVQPAPAQSAVTVSAAARARFAPIALDVFIEYASATGLRRKRLRSSWYEMREVLGASAAILRSLHLDKHADNARSLARELGKQVGFSIEISAVEVTPAILSAIDVALLHLVRNAVDHGIETPAERVAAGKPEMGHIAIFGEVIRGELYLTVRDDGAGISLDRVRARALELGLISETTDISTSWMDLLCTPGFSTRSDVTEVSGRGIGLDAVRSCIADLGGTLDVTTEPGRGSTWSIVVPVPQLTINGHLLRVPNLPFPIVIDKSWILGLGHSNARIIDIAATLGVAEPSPSTCDVYFTRGRESIGFRADGPPRELEVRRIVQTPPTALAEIVLAGAQEGLLLRPDRWTQR